MKKSFFLLSTFLIFNIVIGQEIKNLSKDYFEVVLSNGFTLNRSKSFYGAHQLENKISNIHNLAFRYHRVVNEKIHVNAGWSLGFNAFDFKLGPHDIFQGSSSISHFDRVLYQVFHQFSLGGSYIKKLNEQYDLKFNLGFAINHFPPQIKGFGSHYIPGGEECFIIYTYQKQPIPIIQFGTEISKRTKNQDIISLRVFYNQSFKNSYHGTYRLYNNSSWGDVYNLGSSFNIGLGYAYTRNKKLSFLQTYKPENLNKKEAKKEWRKEKRYIHPKSNFIGLYGGLGIEKNKVSDVNNYIQNAGFSAGLFPRVTFEKGLTNQLYLDLGYHFYNYWSIVEINAINTIFNFIGGPEFSSHQISVGAMYRFVMKNNYNLLNVHLGLSSGLVVFPDKLYPSDSYEFYLNNGYMNYVSYSREKKSHILACLYMGISKDFMLHKRLYLSVSYRYQQGLVTISQRNFSYTLTDSPEIINEANSKMNGTKHSFQMGLKVKINDR